MGCGGSKDIAQSQETKGAKAAGANNGGSSATVNSNKSAAPSHGSVKTVGLLKVTVKSAKDLPKTDVLSKSDPFALLAVGDQIFRTKHIDNTDNPEWNQTCRFIINDKQESYKLFIKIFDKDTVSSNDYMCEASIDVESFFHDGGSDSKDSLHTIPLENARDEKMKGKNLGSVIISATTTSREELIRKFWISLIDMVDASGDGYIDVKELQTVFDFCENSTGDAEELFKAADVDKSGRLSKQELAEACLNTEKNLIKLKSCPYCSATTEFGSDDYDAIAHMAKCFDKSENPDDDFADGGFLSEGDATRGWFFKLSEWTGFGSYERGEGQAFLNVLNRENGAVEREKIDAKITIAMKAAYSTWFGKALRDISNLNLLKNLSEKQGRKYNHPDSVSEIPTFIEFFGLDMSQFEPENWKEYKNFNEFFYRPIKPSARPIFQPEDDTFCVSPADCRLSVFPTTAQAKTLWVKGKNFTIAKLLQDEELAKEFDGGPIAIARLAPQDYHRFHFPVSGTPSAAKDINGAYYTVNPIAVNEVDVFTENKRTVTEMETKEFGKVVVICIGATMVGTIVHEYTPDAPVKKGDLMGYFAFGGSTVITLFRPGSVVFDYDLVSGSESSLETLVKIGDSLGVTP